MRELQWHQERQAYTGSAFSLLPAENATGNWIKAVQRLPARIELDRQELASHPLRIGLSMDVDVNVRNDTGKGLSTLPDTVYQTDVFEQYGRQADAEIDLIITENAGTGTDTDTGSQVGSDAARTPKLR